MLFIWALESHWYLTWIIFLESEIKLASWSQRAVAGFSFWKPRLPQGVILAGKRGAPSISFAAVSPIFQTLSSLHTKTMAMTTAMVWSRISVCITNNRRQRPQRTNMSSWCEGIVVKASIAFNSGVAYSKRPLFHDVRNNYTAPSPTKDLWAVNTPPQPAHSKEMII